MLNDILNSVNILSINLDLCWQIGLMFDSEEGKANVDREGMKMNMATALHGHSNGQFILGEG